MELDCQNFFAVSSQRIASCSGAIRLINFFDFSIQVRPSHKDKIKSFFETNSISFRCLCFERNVFVLDKKNSFVKFVKILIQSCDFETQELRFYVNYKHDPSTVNKEKLTDYIKVHLKQIKFAVRDVDSDLEVKPTSSLSFIEFLRFRPHVLVYIFSNDDSCVVPKKDYMNVILGINAFNCDLCDAITNLDHIKQIIEILLQYCEFEDNSREKLRNFYSK